MERIHRIIAQAGIASRRKAEELIKQGRVKINGKKASIGQSASWEDTITVDDRRIEREKKAYYKFYKPKGYVTTMGEEHGAKTITELIDVSEKVFPVGRLDKDAEGLILLTNDGDWAEKISHPRYEVEKEYEVELDRPYKDKLENIKVEGRKVQAKGNKERRQESEAANTRRKETHSQEDIRRTRIQSKRAEEDKNRKIHTQENEAKRDMYDTTYIILIIVKNRRKDMGKAPMLLGIIAAVAILGLVISIGSISGQYLNKIRPGRNNCPWQYGTQLLEVSKPIPPGCIHGQYTDGTPTDEWMCCNTDYWKAKPMPEYRWKGQTASHKYVREKSKEGKYY